MPFDGDKKRRYNRVYYRTRTKQEREAAAAQRAMRQELRPAKRRLITFRLDEGLVARAHKLKEEAIVNGTYPYKTIGQVWRDLIRRGFVSLKGTSEMIDEAMPYIELSKQIENMRQPRVDAESILQNTMQEIDSLLEIKAETEAAQFYWTAMATAKKMSPSKWQEWLISELEQRYPQLAKSPPPGVKLRRGGKDTNAAATTVTKFKRVK